MMMFAYALIEISWEWLLLGLDWMIASYFSSSLASKEVTARSLVMFSTPRVSVLMFTPRKALRRRIVFALVASN